MFDFFAAFSENLILTAHPSKSGGDWWYGTILRDKKSGFFPRTYVDQIQSSKLPASFSPGFIIMMSV
jgi:actin cytoskeleton-regulatory complex protein PAN1